MDVKDWYKQVENLGVIKIAVMKSAVIALTGIAVVEIAVVEIAVIGIALTEPAVIAIGRSMDSRLGHLPLLMRSSCWGMTDSTL